MVPKAEKSPTSGLTGSAHERPPQSVPAPAASVPVLPGFEDLGYVFNCTYGHYPWDDWEKDALAAGVAKDLAGLGRSTMREAFQHAWDDDLRRVCGWHDQGQEMIKLALRSPKRARRQWEILLRTDGFRGDYPPRSTEWQWGYLRRDAQRLCQTLFGS